MIIKFTLKLVKTAAATTVRPWLCNSGDGDGLPNLSCLVEGAQYTEKDILCKTVIIKAN